MNFFRLSLSNVVEYLPEKNFTDTPPLTNRSLYAVWGLQGLSKALLHHRAIYLLALGVFFGQAVGHSIKHGNSFIGMI